MVLCLTIFLGMVPGLEGLIRTITSDLPGRLGSCVVSVLRENRQADDVETCDAPKQDLRDVCPSGVAEIYPGVARCNGLGYSVQQVVEWPEVLANS